MSLSLVVVFFTTETFGQDIWTKTSLIDKYQVACLAEISNELYAGLAGGGIYKSTNGGSTWSEINGGLGYR